MTMITNSSSVPPLERRLHRWSKRLATGLKAPLATRAKIMKEVKDALRRAGVDGVCSIYEQTDYREECALYLYRGSSRVDLQACKLGTGRRFTTS
jgi:hypothetical protein